MISIVVPTFNRIATLRQTLTALGAQDYPDYEIIVVDDGSTDGTGEMVAREYPSVRYVRQSNRGPAAARNAGIRYASGDIVAFTDDDCLPPVDWLSRLMDGYERYPAVVGVGGYLEAPADVLRHNILARYEQWVSREEYGARDVEVMGGFECPAGGTNNMSYRKSVLERVGGFDETFPYAAGEDADLKWRICQTGAQLLYVPVKMTHLQPYTFEAFHHQQITRGRGAVHFLRKNGRIPSTAGSLLRAIWRSGGCTVYLARHGPLLTWVRLWNIWCEWWGQSREIQRLAHANHQGSIHLI